MESVVEGGPDAIPPPLPHCSRNPSHVEANPQLLRPQVLPEGEPGSPAPTNNQPGHAPGLEVPHHRSFWLWIMCLTGVDYFSTLGYQPSIAFDSAGVLAPIATVVLVLVTLFGALPVYSHVAESSSNGQGSIAMLERLVHGWTGKTMVLALLGFAATDFVITKTLSAADAAEHLIHNPLWEHMPAVVLDISEDHQRMGVTVCFAAHAQRHVHAWLQGGHRAGRGHCRRLSASQPAGHRQRTGVPARASRKVPVWYRHLTTGEWHLKHEHGFGRAGGRSLG